MKWGEIWWAETAHAGRRPAVILARPQTIPVMPVVLTAFATTTVRGLDTEVPVDESDGMPRACVLNLDTPELTPKSMLVDRLGQLSSQKMAEVCRALRAATSC